MITFSEGDYVRAIVGIYKFAVPVQVTAVHPYTVGIVTPTGIKTEINKHCITGMSSREAFEKAGQRRRGPGDR